MRTSQRNAFREPTKATSNIFWTPCGRRDCFSPLDQGCPLNLLIRRRRPHNAQFVGATPGRREPCDPAAVQSFSLLTLMNISFGTTSTSWPLHNPNKSSSVLLLFTFEKIKRTVYIFSIVHASYPSESGIAVATMLIWRTPSQADKSPADVTSRLSSPLDYV